MGRPIRFFEPERLYFITSRCHQAQFLLRPDADTNEVVSSVVARALHLYPVKLYGFMTLSNHIHAIVQGSPEHIASWARYTFGEIARRINKLRKRTGAFWARRYSAEPILDDGAAWDKLTYLLANPVQSHLVTDAKTWPGFSTLHEALGGQLRTFSWFDAEGFRRASCGNKSVSKADFTQHYPLRVTQLPDSEHLTATQYAETLEGLLRVRQEEAAQCRKRSRRRVAPIDKLVRIRPTASPKQSKRSRRPLCHATTLLAWKAYKAMYAAFKQAFADAVDALKKGQTDVLFPSLAFRPSIPP